MMLGDKIIPSLYFIELEGAAANLEFILGKDFGIERITIGSYDFQNDMRAMAAAEQALAFFFQNELLDLSTATETVDLNPEFFPTAEKIEEEDEEVILEDDGSFKLTNAITKKFDEKLGDFVQLRQTYEGSNFKMVLRVVANPEYYATLKSLNSVVRAAELTTHREVSDEVRIH